jgi:hypothetical protein
MNKTIKTIKKIRPKNDWAKVLFILNDSDKVSMADVLTKYDSTFYKFQARLSEIEREHGFIVGRKLVPFKNKLTGKSGYFTEYSYKNKRELKSLLTKVNEFGLAGKKD